MGSTRLGEATEKFEASHPTSPKLQESQPGSNKSHVIEQGSPINSSSSHVRVDQGVDAATHEKTGDLVESDEHPEYPHGIKLATITVAVALSVFLVALVRHYQETPDIPFLSANDV